MQRLPAESASRWFALPLLNEKYRFPPDSTPAWREGNETARFVRLTAFLRQRAPTDNIGFSLSALYAFSRGYLRLVAAAPHCNAEPGSFVHAKVSLAWQPPA